MASAAVHTDEHAHNEPSIIVTTIGVVSALAMGWLLGLVMPQVLHAPRFAVGIAMAVIGFLFGTTSNSAGAFPNLQRFMETFGISLAAFGLVRYFNFAGIMSGAEGFIGTLGKFLTLFM
jgi:hypothetical protein